MNATQNNQVDQVPEQDLENFNGTIHYTDVAEFVIVRAPSDPKLFVVVALDKEGNYLYTTSSEIDYETAQKDVEQLSKDIVILQEIEDMKF